MSSLSAFGGQGCCETRHEGQRHHHAWADNAHCSTWYEPHKPSTTSLPMYCSCGWWKYEQGQITLLEESEIKMEANYWPRNHGKLGILDVSNFSCAMQLQRPWVAWKDPHRAWTTLDNPCNNDDMALSMRSLRSWLGMIACSYRIPLGLMVAIPRTLHGPLLSLFKWNNKSIKQALRTTNRPVSWIATMMSTY
jgi:hypothetical protein